MGSVVLPTLRQKREVDAAIRDTLDKVLVLRFGRAADAACLHLDDVLAKSSWDTSKFATIALVDMDSEEIQVYIDYFDITLDLAMLCTRMDSFQYIQAREIVFMAAVQTYSKFIDMIRFIIAQNVGSFGTKWTHDHTKWIGSFSSKQDFIDVVEAIFRGAMKGKLIVSCPLPPERIPRFQLLFKDV